ncbi:MAG: type III secretion system export apparatus subunit SctV [Myxococcales bacterium]|nr:type III secretion system export apparatus subunit SctV [Myxococcales bacterium]MCB9648062.1 type III secretion system export apparatus subunit SctV [Deltaproteobacteria bacterium]
MKGFIAVLTTGDLRQAIGRYSDIGLAALVMLIISMLIIPLPPFMLDVLIVVNISISVLLLLLAMYIPNALHLASFPSLLLVTTLFRLSLNVSSTRLILLTAQPGEVIKAFGNFVVSGNLVVGIVIFLILTIIQFLVITKGAERVAEVAARFTLDAMPGKQMSIDADLRAGAFDMDEARRKRNDLNRESQLFGSMDGAMKFVKGDSIAGLIITAINIVAGVIIGVTMMNMGASEALSIFALLTVGDGLVSQIPALLISITAGLIVTRVASEESENHLGRDISFQLLAQPKAFVIASVLLVLFGLVPGLPTLPFFLMAAVTGATGYGLNRTKRLKAEGKLQPIDDGGMPSEQDVKEQREKRIQAQKMQEGQSQQMLPVVTPIALEVAADLIPLVEDTGEGSKFLGEMIPMMRDGLFYELGVRFPGIRVRGNETDMPPGSYLIMINEIPLVMGTVSQDKVLVNDTVERLRLLNIDGEPATNPANGNECAWVDAQYQDVAEQAGLTTWDASGYIVLHLSSVLRKNGAEFVGIQETMNMLEQLEQAFPALVKETVPKVVSPFQLTDILRRLIEEEISIRDLRSILQALAEWGQVEHDTVMLTEYVRAALKRYISHKYTRGQNTLIVYLLDPQIEETVRSSIQHTSSGSYLALEPEITQEILSAVRTEVGSLPPTAQNPVILTTMEIRRYFRKLVELEFPHLAVLSYQELSPDMNIQPIARISLE